MRFASILLFIAVIPLCGQEVLPLNISHYYSLTEQVLPTNLLRYPADRTIERVRAILAAAEAEQDFTVIAANVSSVVVAYAGGKAYLLYSPQFLTGQPQEEIGDMILALAIGYLIHDHTLAPRNLAPPYPQHPDLRARYAAETLEAANFAGYVFYNLYGYAKSELEKVPLQWGILPNADRMEVAAAMQAGYARAETLLLLGPSASYNDEGSGQDLPIPAFPFPPPSPSTIRDLKPYFSEVQRMGQIADLLEQGLEKKGYYERQYYYVNGGFALITRIEQINPDGSSMPAPQRWLAKPFRVQDSWLDYVRELFTSSPGRFRVFVFIVSDSPMRTDQQRTVSRGIVESWLSGGTSSLPYSMRQQAVQPFTNINVLIYDFSTAEVDGKSSLNIPSPLTSEAHLSKAGILTYIKR